METEREIEKQINSFPYIYNVLIIDIEANKSSEDNALERNDTVRRLWHVFNHQLPIQLFVTQ